MFKIILTLLIICLIIDCIFIEPNKLKVTEYKINNKDLSGLKAVFVGDFHFKKNDTARLEKVINLIKLQNPDVIFSTGDYVAGHTLKTSLEVEKIATAVGTINPKYGFYTVLGNHDWWADGELITSELENNGIIVLENSSAKFVYNNK